VALGPVDWAAMARSFGLEAFVVTDETEAADAIEQALAGSGPALIDARIDASNYPATLEVVRG
jgi:thiamine pyrophosphate-dependent acetolactate synthase large subunit-like protein